MHSIRWPPSPMVIHIGGLSNPLRSTMRIFPFSVPKYRVAPSGENVAEVRGILRFKVRNKLCDSCRSEEFNHTS